MKNRRKPMRQWYFEGYEWQETVDQRGKKRRELVYTGLYYRYETEKPSAAKGRVGVLTGLYLCLLIAMYFLPCDTMRYGWMGAVSLCVLIPAIYLAVGLVFFLLQKPPFTHRQTYAGYYRMLRSLWWSRLLTAAVLVCDVVFLILRGGELEILPELMLPGALVILLALSLIVTVQLKRMPPKAESN